MGFFNLFKTFWRKKEIIVDKTSESTGISDFKFRTSIDPRFQDFDMMGHVNNAVYFTYMEIGRTRYWKNAINWNWERTGVIVAAASIDYILPIHINEPLSMYVRTSRIGNTSFDLEYMLVKTIHGEEVVCSKGKTVCVAFDYNVKQPVAIPEMEQRKMRAFEQLG